MAKKDAKKPAKPASEVTSTAVASKAASLIHTSDSADVRSVAASALSQAPTHDTAVAGEVVTHDTGPVVLSGVDMVTTPIFDGTGDAVIGNPLADAYDEIARLKHELDAANEKLAEQLAYNQRRRR
jgi:stage V sporulation protein SpoVS